MARWYGSTAERALGGKHAADAKHLKAVMREGAPCWRCGEPMYSWQDLDRDHVIDRVHGGANGPAVLAHASCNRSRGATMGNQMRGFTPAAARAGQSVTCKACGKPYHYAARSCEMCGAHYHPSYGQQRTCGRACGLQLRRRNGSFATGAEKRRKNWPSSPVYARDCATCGEPFVGKHSGALYCSPRCSSRSTIAQPRPVIGTGSCERCGQPFELKSSGRTRRWCSGSCRSLASMQRKAEGPSARGWVTSRPW